MLQTFMMRTDPRRSSIFSNDGETAVVSRNMRSEGTGYTPCRLWRVVHAEVFIGSDLDGVERARTAVAAVFS